MGELRITEGANELRLVSQGEAVDGYVEVRAEVRSAWFRVELVDELACDEVADLADALRALHSAGAGAHVFLARENWIELTFAMSKQGQLAVTARLQWEPDYLNEVKLVLHLDQSYVPTIAAELDSLLASE